jgi:hypothetical protein
VLSRGGVDTDVIHDSARGGDGTVLQLDRGSPDSRGPGNQCASPRGERAADSDAVGHGASDLTQKSEVDSMAGRGREGSLPRVRHGSLLVSLTSSESSKGRATHHWGKTDLSPGRVEVRAGAVFALTTHGVLKP